MKYLLKFNFIILSLALLGQTAIAQVERSKAFDNTWDGIKRVTVSHRYGALEVVKSTSNQTRLEAQIKVRADEAADAQIMIDHFEIKSNKFSDELEIETKFPTKSWNTTNNNTKIKFQDGAKVSGIKDYEVKYKLHIPDLDRLKLSNKYNDIEIATDVNCQVEISQYDAAVITKNINGKLDLSIKYGRGRLGNVGDSDIYLYDSELECESIGSTTANVKYSDMEIGRIASMDMTSYDNECVFGNVTGSLRINDKYSEFEVTSAQEVKLTMYDGEFKIGSAGKFYSTSKYADITIIKTDLLDIQKSYDDTYSVRELGEFNAFETKYTTYKIENLGTKAALNSYDDVFEVSGVSEQFELFDLDAKYSDVKLPLNNLSGYTINANMKYGKLGYPEPSEHILLRETNDVTELELRIGTGGSAKVKIKSYDSNIRLN